MSGHTMTIDLTNGTSWSSSYSVTCNEPPEAPCRAEWECACDYFAAHGTDEKGHWHETGDEWLPEEGRTRHYAKPGGECTYKVWLENDDEIPELGSGEVTFPITVTWDDDHYNWAVAR